MFKDWSKDRSATGLPLIIFIMLIDYKVDCIMKAAINFATNRIKWALINQLNDLNFADDAALMFQARKQLQDKLIMPEWKS